MKNLLFIASFLSLTFLFSCEKEVFEVKNESPHGALTILDHVSMENGMLKFETREDLDETLKYMVQENQEGIFDFEDHFQGFLSNKTAFDALTEEDLIKKNGDMSEFESIAHFLEVDGEKYLEPVIDSRLMQQIANQVGVFMVGDVVYKITYSNYLEINSDDYLESMSQKELEGIAITNHPIIRDNSKSTVAYCSKVYAYKRGKQYRKMISRWEIDPVYYSPISSVTTAYIRTSNYKRGAFGAWYKDFAYKLEHSGSASLVGINQSGNEVTGTLPFSLTGTNVKEISTSVAFNLGYNTLAFINPSSGLHKVKKFLDNSWQVCGINI